MSCATNPMIYLLLAVVQLVFSDDVRIVFGCDVLVTVG